MTNQTVNEQLLQDVTHRLTLTPIEFHSSAATASERQALCDACPEKLNMKV